MCGRYLLFTNPEKLALIFRARIDALIREQWQARYNIAPSSPALVVRMADIGRVIEPMRWGLIPHWSREPVTKYPTFNARSEEAADKASYRGPMRYRRCLVPVDGFYEWQRSGSQKQPYVIRMADEAPFALAGLWDAWQEELQSFSILTTRPNEVMEKVHNRMPVIVQPEDYTRWLDPNITDPQAVADILKPFPADQMYAAPVSDYVNNGQHDGPQCMTPVT
jgi:putative SOS response-associated peptidase YedK